MLEGQLAVSIAVARAWLRNLRSISGMGDGYVVDDSLLQAEKGWDWEGIDL